MGRTRHQNRAARESKLHIIPVSNQERLVLSWLLASSSGYNREEGIKVRNIIDSLGLENVAQEITDKNLEEVEEYELSGYEVSFLLDEIKATWDKKTIKAGQIKPILSIEEKLTASLHAPSEDLEEEPVKE